MAANVIHLCYRDSENFAGRKRLDEWRQPFSALLGGLTTQECHEIMARAKPRFLRRGKILYSQGEPGNTFLMIQLGVMKISQKDREGNPVILWLSGIGDCMGVHHENEYMHTCSAEALEDCGLLEWPRYEMVRLCAAFPRLLVNIDQILIRRIHQLEGRFTEIATEKVAQRMALLLIRLERVIGKRTCEGVELVLKREELAQMIGASIFSVSRLLAEWSESGIIVAGRRAIVIPDLSRLRLAGNSNTQLT